MAQDERTDEFVGRFVRNQRALYGFILTIVSNANEADDILQETSLVLWKKREHYQPSLEFLPWACGIARQVARNYRAKRARDRHWFSDEILDRIAAEHGRRSEWLENVSKLLDTCIQQLTDEQRALIDLRYEGERSIEDVAEELGAPANTVYQRLHRIRQRLYDCIRFGLRRQAAT